MKKLLSVVLALIMVLSFAACGGEEAPQEPSDVEVSEQTPAISETEPDTEPEQPEEEPFVPDYTPGNENTACLRNFRDFGVQQDQWIYYGVSSNRHTQTMAEYIFKIPVGGTQEDIVKIYDRYADDNPYVFTCTCGHSPYDNEVELYGVIGDWMYVGVGNNPDQHIYRIRTDGKIMEFVFCMVPNENTIRYYWAIRDGFMYFIDNTTTQLDANTKETVTSLCKIDLNGDWSEVITCVSPIPFNDDITWFDDGSEHNFIKDNILYSGFYNGSILFCVHEDDTIEMIEKGSDKYYEVYAPYAEKGVDAKAALMLEDGFIFINDVLNYYSYETETATKINNDGEIVIWMYPGDGYLYYQDWFGDVNFCRVKIDGTGGWEEVDWLFYINE